MPQSRSYEDLGPGQQLYNVIEMCNQDEVLWAKLDSGHYDWLGVEERKGRSSFLLGRPALRPRGASHVAAIVSAATASLNPRYEVFVFVPVFGLSTGFRTDDRTEADTRFDYYVEQCRAMSGSGLWRIKLKEAGQNIREELVVRQLPNRL